ncbi:MAG: PCRF domain-containing protein, partial [Thermoleophilaceae bacterium]
MIEKLVEQIDSRFGELSAQMSDPEVIGDRERYAQVGRDYRALQTAHELAQDWKRAVDDAAGARELLAEGEDPEMRSMLQAAEADITRLEEEIRLSMVERDPNDDKNVIVEVRG